MKTYQYSSLNVKAQEIRLLTLSPGGGSADVHLHLEIIPFTAGSIPHFEALSYTWGSTDAPTSVIVDGPVPSKLAVTRNLAEALHYLRYGDRFRVLWIDAICTNQRDPHERGQQVERMADVLSRATRVVVWLGPESYDSSAALDCIDLASKRVTVDWEMERMYPTSSEEHWSKEDTALPFNKSELLSIFTFFDRPWFERIWIWQEVRLASRETRVTVGNRTIPWESIRTAVFCIARKLHLPLGIDPRLTVRIKEVYQLCDGMRSLSSPTLIDQTNRSQCSDPRDRVFALLSLLHPSERMFGISADYTKSVAEVYKDAMIRWSQGYRSLRLLQTVEMSEGVERMPSWVPDWGMTRATTGLSYCNTSPTILGLPFGFLDGTLAALGVSIANIKSVEKFRLSKIGSTSTREIIQEFKRISATKGVQELLSSDESGLSVFCRVVSSNSFSELQVPPSISSVSLKQSETILRGCLEPDSALDDENISFDAKRFLRRAHRYCHDRSLFKTREGYVGLGPAAAAAGDLVAVLLDCASPLVLRPKPDKQFLVVGEAYCDGFMDCEAFLGPIPPSLQPVTRYDEASAVWRWAHIGHTSGHIYSEDPRLGPLPDNWTRRSHAREKLKLVG